MHLNYRRTIFKLRRIHLTISKYNKATSSLGKEKVIAYVGLLRK